MASIGAKPGEALEGAAVPDQSSIECGDETEGGHDEGTEEERDFEGEMEGVEEGGQFADMVERDTECIEEDAYADECGDPGDEELAGDGAVDSHIDLDEDEASHDISWVEELWNLKQAKDAIVKGKKSEDEKQSSQTPDVEMDDFETAVSHKEEAKDVEESEALKLTPVTEKVDPDKEDVQEETSADNKTTVEKKKLQKTPFSTMKSMVHIPPAYFGPAFDENSFQFCVRVSSMVYKDFQVNDWSSVIRKADCVHLKLRRQQSEHSPRMMELYSQNPACLMLDLMFSKYALQTVSIQIVMKKATEWKDFATEDDEHIKVPLGFSSDDNIKASFRVNNVHARTKLYHHLHTSVNMGQPAKQRSLFISNIPPAVPQRVLKLMFPLCSRVSLVNVSESKRSAVLTMKSHSMVIDHLIAYYSVFINGNELELGAVNMSQVDAVEGLQNIRKKSVRNVKSKKNDTTTATQPGTGTSKSSDYEEQKIKDSEKNERIKKAQERAQNRQKQTPKIVNPKLTESSRTERDTRTGSLRSRGRARGRGRNLSESYSRQRRASNPFRKLSERERQMQRDMQRFELEMHQIEKQKQMQMQREIQMQEELERQRERERQMERMMHQEKTRRNFERNQELQWEERERRKFERIRQQEEEEEKQKYRQMIKESERMKKMHEDAIHKLKKVEQLQRQEREEMERMKRQIEMERLRLQQEQQEQDQRRQQQHKEEQELSRKRGRADEGSRPGAGEWQHRGPIKRGKSDKGEWDRFYGQSNSEMIGMQDQHNERSAGQAGAGPGSEESIRQNLELEVARQAEELKKSLALLDKIQKVPTSLSAGLDEMGYNRESFDQGYQHQQQTYNVEYKQPETYSSMSQNYGYDTQVQGYGHDQLQSYGQDQVQGYGQDQAQGYGQDQFQFVHKQDGGDYHQNIKSGDNLGGWYKAQDQNLGQTFTWGAGAQEMGGWSQKDKSSASTRVYVRGQGRSHGAERQERTGSGNGGRGRFGQKWKGNRGGGRGAGYGGNDYQSKGSYY